MRIDIRSEKLIRFSEVKNLPWLPRRSDGRPIHDSTVYRWASEGIGGVKLEHMKTPFLCTTEAAILRFFERITEPPEETAKRNASESAHTRAVRRLEAAGL